MLDFIKNKSDLLFLVILFSFAPYVYPNIPLPLGPLFVYFLFFYLFIKHRYALLEISRELSVFFLMFASIAVFGIFSTFLNFNGGDELLMIKKISQLESSLRPLFLLGIWGYVAKKNSREEYQVTFLKISYLFVFILFVNTILAVSTIFIPDMPKILKIFHAYESTIPSVAENSAALGRYTGIFCQPISAGFAYALGMLLMVYVFRKKTPSLWDCILLFFLFIGGLLTLSKVSIFVGLFLFIVYGSVGENIFFARKRISFVFLAIFIGVVSPIFSLWKGEWFFNYLKNLIFENDLLSAFSSGRYGSESNGYIDYVLSKYNTIIGSGYGLSLFDSGYLYYFLVSGVAGFVGFIILNLYMFFLAIYKTSEENRLLLFVGVLFIFANFGAPIGVEPIISTVFWVIVFSLTDIIAFNSVMKIDGN